MEYRKPTQHRMGRRLSSHDYTRPGIYHITIHVADGLGHPLGTVVGADADSAAVALSRVGQLVEHELTTAITRHYPMVTVDAFVVMPEHLHFILIVRDPIVSKSGRPAHLGQVIAGFKKGCNRAFWAATGQQVPPGEPAGALLAPAFPPGEPAGALLAPAASTAPGSLPAGFRPLFAPAFPPGEPAGALFAPAASTAPGGLPAGFRPPSTGSSGRPPSTGSSGLQPLFAPTYCDVMPIEPGQLETQRAYIRNNPKSRWLRSHDRARLQTQRGGIDTALTPAALRGFLKRECLPSQATPEALAAIEARLLLNGGNPAAPSSPTIICDSYVDRALLQRRLLPVVCHRKDAPRFSEQKTRSLEEAAKGTVLVSPRIAKGEQAIIDDASHRGFPVVLVSDNGFPPVYHPSADRIALCSEGCLLLITPWQYQYQVKEEAVTVPFCKTMNCVTQALCRKKDNWWKEKKE